ncbi:MAG: hypothetical protein ABEI77_01255 [Halorientalis sp.]
MGPDDESRSAPDHERVQEQARVRQHERAETVESELGRVGMLDEDKYPVTSDELAVEYADTVLDLPNETESLGSVFDSIVTERFDSPAEAVEAIVHELTGEADGLSEYNDERALSDLPSGDDERDRRPF